MYYEIYVLGYKIPQTPSLVLGKWVADELKKPKSKSPLIEQIRMFIPKWENRETEFRVQYKDINLLRYFDDYSESEEDIIEIKTGVKWNQSMVNKHAQLDFYAFMYYIRYNKLPKRIRLIWLKTEKDDNGEVYLTGDFKVFERKMTMADIIKISGRIIKVHTEIQEMYRTLRS